MEIDSIPLFRASEVMGLNQSVADAVERDGFVVIDDVLEPSTVRRFANLVDEARQRSNPENVANGSGTYGLRNLTDVLPEVVELVQHWRVAELVEVVAGPDAFMVRATLFDKTPGANWGVFWHQDLSVAVRERHDVDGCSGWTVKAGVASVQPPVEVMEQILAVRLHLDDCYRDNGALKVLPGTHRLQRLNAEDVQRQQRAAGEKICETPAGGAVLMRPLLLHASSPMKAAGTRRVIHFEFAASELPRPLEWRYRLACRSN